MPYITTLDIEASGIHGDSYPIEVGVALPDGSTWCSLIKPAPHWQHWNQSAADIHGVSRSELVQYGRSATEVAGKLNELLTGLDVYSDYWVLDNPWLVRLFQQAALEQRFRLVDVMYLFDEDRYAKLNETRKQIANEQHLQRHRASNDAHILQLACRELLG